MNRARRKRFGLLKRTTRIKNKQKCKSVVVLHQRRRLLTCL